MVILRFKEFLGLQDDIKILRKTFHPWPLKNGIIVIFRHLREIFPKKQIVWQIIEKSESKVGSDL